MAAVLVVVLGTIIAMLHTEIGKAKQPAPLASILAKSSAINRLSAARFFLFASRDIWFVVALPVFLSEQFDWSFEAIGAFLAAWVIGYGAVQSVAPRLIGVDHVHAATSWSLALALLTAAIATAVAADTAVSLAVIGGLIAFGVVFAVNSSLHSYLILAYSRGPDDVAMDVGFYYSANAMGRLVGTLLSGLLYLWGGLSTALWGSAAFLTVTWLLTLRLPAFDDERATARPEGRAVSSS